MLLSRIFSEDIPGHPGDVPQSYFNPSEWLDVGRTPFDQIQFDFNGQKYTAKAYSVTTDFGPETLVMFYNAEGKPIDASQEAASMKTIIGWWKRDQLEMGSAAN